MIPWPEQLALLRRVGFDTNALVYLTQGVTPYAPLVAGLVKLLAQGRLTGVVSTVVELELLVRPLRQRDQPSLERIELFLRETPNLVMRSLDRTIARRAADIRARTGLRVPDAIIVATAREERCDALIGNDRRVAAMMTGVPYLLLDDYV